MIVGFSFNKLSVEKKSSITGKIDINTNVEIKDVTSFGKQKQKGVTFLFEFKSQYEPNVGNVSIEGELVFLGDAKLSEDLVKGWKANKKVPAEIMEEVMSNILNRCYVEAIVLSRDINLPPPIPLPSVKRDVPMQKQPLKSSKA